MDERKNDKNNKTAQTKFLRLFFTIIILIAIVIVGYIIIKTTGVWEKINSIEKIRKIVESGGIFSFVIFIVLQILQTTVLQLPAFLVTLAGTIAFGRWTAFFLSYIAIVVGSLIMFWIGRKAGRKFLNWLVGEEDADKWIKKMTNGKYLFFLMMIFPLFPDDVLCLVAGLTNMSFGFFLTTNLISRAIGVSCTVFFGSGAIIPFSGWGLIVWGIVILLILTLFYLSVKYQKQIDETLRKVFNKRV